MGYSAFKLVATGADGKSIRNTHSQDLHNFKAGQVVRYELGGAGWTAASATDAESAEAVGVIEEVLSISEFVVVYQGEINTAGFAEGYGVTGDADTHDVWFLSAGASGGKLDNVAPTSGGNVIKPVLIRTTGSTALVTGYVGTVIGGKSTVSLDEVNPVGTILPYAGVTTDIPAQWSECDGGAVKVNEYGDYYNRVGRIYGFYQTLIFPSDGTSVDLSSYAPAEVTFAQDDGSGVAVTAKMVSWNQETLTAVVDVNHMTNDEPNYQHFNTNNTITVTRPTDGDFVFSAPKTAHVTHVKKPDFRGRVAIGGGAYEATNREFVIGEMGGKDAVTLTEEQIPSHTHSVSSSVSSTSIASALRTLHSVGGGAGNKYVRAGSNTTFDYGAVYPSSSGSKEAAIASASGANVAVSSSAGNFGGDVPHDNMQPYLVTTYIIRLKSEASAAVIGSFNLADNNLSDHNTPNPTKGDVVVFHKDVAGNSGEYRNFGLFDGITSGSSQFVHIDMSTERVGIGTSTPGGTLDVKGDIHVTDPNSSVVSIKLYGENDVETVPDVEFSQKSLLTAGESITLGMDKDDEFTNQFFSVQKNSNVLQGEGVNEILHLNENGRLGIGSDASGIRPDTEDGNPQFKVHADGSGKSHITLKNTGTGNKFTTLTQKENSLEIETDSNGTVLKNNTTIGPTATVPNSDTIDALHVEGNVKSTGNLTADTVNSTGSPLVLRFISGESNVTVLQGNDNGVTVTRNDEGSYTINHKLKENGYITNKDQYAIQGTIINASEQIDTFLDFDGKADNAIHCKVKGRYGSGSGNVKTDEFSEVNIVIHTMRPELQ